MSTCSFSRCALRTHTLKGISGIHDIDAHGCTYAFEASCGYSVAFWLMSASVSCCTADEMSIRLKLCWHSLLPWGFVMMYLCENYFWQSFDVCHISVHLQLHLVGRPKLAHQCPTYDFDSPGLRQAWRLGGRPGATGVCCCVACCVCYQVIPTVLPFSFSTSSDVNLKQAQY